MLHPKSLSIAVTLADTGSATLAARALDISQPTVSYHVNKLETALGTSLFQRTPGGLVPTSEGELLVNRAREILIHLDRLERDVRSAATERPETLRVSSACFTNYHWLPEVLELFRVRHGEVGVELDVDPSRRPFEDLDRGVLDLAFTTVPPPGDDFILHELFEDEIVAVVHPAHPLADRSHLEPEDFADQSVVVFDRAQSDLFNLALTPAGVRPRYVTDISATDAILELVRAGVAVSAMASWVAEPALMAGRLRAVRIGPDGLRRTWWAVQSSRRRPVRPIVRDFLDVLTERCSAPSGGWRSAATGSASPEWARR